MSPPKDRRVDRRVDPRPRRACSRLGELALALCTGLSALAAGPSAQAASDAAANRDAADAAFLSDHARPAYQRQTLVPQPLPEWSSLSAAQREVLNPFEATWQTLAVAERRAWIALADRFAKLSAADQATASARIREWATLTPEQRRMARQNFRLARSLPSEQRVASWERYQSLTEEQRSVLQFSGSTSNTAARHAGSRTALAKQAAQPIAEPARPVVHPPANDPMR
jgi:Protein of unknown function (DUF3106)